MIRITLALTALLLPALAFSGLQLNKDRAVIIEGPIYGDNLSIVMNAMNVYAAKSKAPIDIILNSPGGSVVTGFEFVNLMYSLKGKGIQFRCFVPGMAASMAFQILVQCDERHILDRSFLLWHRVRISVGGIFGEAMTGPTLAHLGKQLLALDALILEELYRSLDMSKEEVLEHFNNETLHTGVILASESPKFVKSYKFIRGLFETLSSEEVPRSIPYENFVRIRRNGSTNDILYIWEGYTEGSNQKENN